MFGHAETVHFAHSIVKAKRTPQLCKMHVMTFDDRPDQAKRLEKARLAAGFKDAAEPCRRFGWNYDTYIQHERGNRGISRRASQYAAAFKVSEAWLLTGEGRGPDRRYGASSVTAPSIPILSWVSAGALACDQQIDEPVGSIFVAGLADGDWIALEVEGDSMDRISPPGSIILIDRQQKSLVPNACYVICAEDGRATYKRYRPSPDRFEPVSTNPEHETFFISNRDNMPSILGRVRMSVLQL